MFLVSLAEAFEGSPLHFRMYLISEESQIPVPAHPAQIHLSQHFTHIFCDLVCLVELGTKPYYDVSVCLMLLPRSSIICPYMWQFASGCFSFNFPLRCSSCIGSHVASLASRIQVLLFERCTSSKLRPSISLYSLVTFMVLGRILVL